MGKVAHQVHEGVRATAFFDLLVLPDDPHHQEERHHGRHEVGIRDLPRSAPFASHF